MTTPIQLDLPTTKPTHRSRRTGKEYGLTAFEFAVTYVDGNFQPCDVTNQQLVHNSNFVKV